MYYITVLWDCQVEQGEILSVVEGSLFFQLVVLRLNIYQSIINHPPATPDRLATAGAVSN